MTLEAKVLTVQSRVSWKSGIRQDILDSMADKDRDFTFSTAPVIHVRPSFALAGKAMEPGIAHIARLTYSQLWTKLGTMHAALPCSVALLQFSIEHLTN